MQRLTGRIHLDDERQDGSDHMSNQPDLFVPASKIQDVPRIAVRRREAAEAIGISERQLQALGDAVPNVRLSERIVLYPLRALDEFLVERARQAVQNGNGNSATDAGDEQDEQPDGENNIRPP